MEKDIYKHLSKHYVPRKHLDDDGPSSANTDASSEAFFDEDDIISSTPKSYFQDAKCNNDISYSDLYSKELEESKLKEEAIDLYQDLALKENAEKASKEKFETELKSLKKELQILKEADAKNSARIKELTTENVNIKKSFCSLLKTAQAEIEHKDNLLAEANSRLDKALSHRSLQNIKFNRQTNNHSYEEADNSSHKRKRSPSPKPLSNAKEPQSSTLKTKNGKDAASDKNVNTSSDVFKSKERSGNESQKTDNQNQCVLYQPSNVCKVVENSKDSTETNDTHFNLLPDSLKQTFYLYEQNQVISLNRLKQSIISEYFKNSGAHVQPLTPNSTQETTTNQLQASSILENASSVTSTTELTSCSNKNSTAKPRDERADKCASDKTDKSRTISKKDHDQSSSSKRARNEASPKSMQQESSRRRTTYGRIPRSMQNDFRTLYSYRRHKDSFLEKRKLGHSKNERKSYH